MDSTASVEYGLTTAYGSDIGSFAYNAGYTSGFGAPANGLLPGTVYHVRARISDGVTTSYGQDVTFQTAPAGGTLLESATESMAGAATFSAMWPAFSYGSSCGPPTSGSPGDAVTRYKVYAYTNASTSPACVTVRYASACAKLASAAFGGTYAGGSPATGGLGAGDPGSGREYQFTVAPGAPFSVVMADDGTCTGYTLHVDSSALLAPSATTGAAADVQTQQATLTGATSTASVTGTSYRFEWGPTAAYGSQTAAVALPADTSAHVASATVTGLQPGSAYHFRLVAGGPGGTSNGADATFTTAVAPLVKMTLRQALVAIASKGRGSIGLQCAAAARTCKGSIAISIATSHGRKTLATARFKGSGAIKARFVLTRDGRLRVRRLKTLKVRLVISAVDAAGNKIGRTTTCRLVWNA